jgi:hypothetical protein
VVEEEPHNKEFDLIYVASPSQLCGAREIIFSSLYFIIYFVRLRLCNKYIYDIYRYALCYYMCFSSLAHI